MSEKIVPDWFYFVLVVYSGVVSLGIGWIAYGEGGIPVVYPIGLAVIVYFACFGVGWWAAWLCFKALNNRSE